MYDRDRFDDVHREGPPTHVQQLLLINTVAAKETKPKKDGKKGVIDRYIKQVLVMRINDRVLLGVSEAKKKRVEYRHADIPNFWISACLPPLDGCLSGRCGRLGEGGVPFVDCGFGICDNSRLWVENFFLFT
mgnify:CR=1 FL=1